MKRLFFFLSILLLPELLCAQHPVSIRNLWTRPQVHVLFAGYTVSFAIRDINKASKLLAETGDTNYGACKLDTSKNYYYELYPGTHTEYRTLVEPLLQNGVGVYLLNCGLAVVENKKHRKLSSIVTDITTHETGEPATFVSFFDPATHEMIFSGRIPVGMIGKDPGLDD